MLTRQGGVAGSLKTNSSDAGALLVCEALEKSHGLFNLNRKGITTGVVENNGSLALGCQKLTSSSPFLQVFKPAIFHHTNPEFHAFPLVLSLIVESHTTQLIYPVHVKHNDC